MPPELNEVATDVKVDLPADTTLATASAAAAAEAAKAATDAAAKTEAERVAALPPEAKAAEDAAKTKAEADAAEKAEAERVAKLTDEQRAAEKEAKAKAEAEAKRNAVPEKYVFKLPEGVNADPEVSAEFEKQARELGLSQEKAQKIYDIGIKLVQKNSEAQAASVATAQGTWLEAAKADKEFGGADLQKNMAVAALAMEFASPEMRTILNESKLGNHPEVVRWMYRVGKAMQEDTDRRGRATATKENDFDAKAARLYPNQ